MGCRQEDFTPEYVPSQFSTSGSFGVDSDSSARLSGRLCDSLPIAALLLTESALVRYINCPARKVLAVPALPIAIREGRFVSTDTRTAQGLRGAIRHVATRGGTRAMRLPRLAHEEAAEGAHLNVVLSQLTCCSGQVGQRDETVVLALLNDEASKVQARPDTIKALFRLTAAETELAAALANGVQVEAYAVQRGISIKTVRSQVASLFAKTGTHRQTDLVALILRLPAHHDAHA